jgi:hypothetical protein
MIEPVNKRYKISRQPSWGVRISAPIAHFQAPPVLLSPIS